MTVSSPRSPRFRLRRELGRGGGGVVMLAEDLAAERTVAIKLATDAEGSARLAREGQLLLKLEHPHLVRARERIGPDSLDPGDTDLRPVGPALVLEWLQGPSLREARLGPDEALLAWAHVAHALEALHGRGWVHRDLRPENVLLRRPAGESPMEAVLIDLGAAAPADVDAQGAGTLDHVAPETLAGAAPRPAADVHGLGGLLFFLLTGRAPWSELPLAQALEARRHAPPELPRDATLDEGLRQALATLLSPWPERRPAGALEAVRLLNQATGAGLPERVGTLAARPGLASWVGREDVLCRVEELLDEPGPRHVVLHGETGSGRSRLLDEVALRARLRGRPVFRGVPATVPDDAVVLLDAPQATATPPSAHGLWFETTAEPRPAADEIVLAALSEDECLELARRVLGVASLTGGDGATLRAASGGLPGRLEQLVAALADEGAVSVESGRLSVDAAAVQRLAEPDRLVTDRSRRLSPEAAVLLDLAAVFRGPVGLPVLAAMSRLSETDDEIQVGLAELRASGLLRGTDPTGREVEVPSPLREVLRERLPDARRRLLHVAAATALEAAEPGSEGEQAWHLEQAGAADRALPLHRRAGTMLLERNLPAEAAVHLRQVVQSGGERGEDLARLLLELARAEALLGDAAAAVQRVETAVPLLRDDAARARALAFAAETASHAGDPTVAEDACRRARRLFRRTGSRAGRAECTSRLASLAAARGDLRRAAAGFRAALGVAREEGDASLEARALNNLGDVARREGRLDDAARHHEDARRLRRQSGDVRGAAKAANNLGVVHGMAGRLDDAAARFDEAAAAFAECGDRREEARSRNNLGMVLWIDGRLEEAERTLAEAARLFGAIGDATLRADAAGNQALVAFDRGRPRVALEILERTVGETADHEPGRRARRDLDLGDVQRACGRLEEARQTHARAGALARQAGAARDEALAELAVRLDEALAAAASDGVPDGQLPTAPDDLERWPTEAALRWHLENARLGEVSGAVGEAAEHGRRARELSRQGAGGHERLLAATLAAGPRPEPAAAEALQDELALVPAGQLADVAWRARLCLARAWSLQGRGLMAGAQAEMARDLIDGLVEQFPEDERPAFLAAEGRARSLDEARDLIESTGSHAGSVAVARAEVAPLLLEFVRLLNAQLEPEKLLPRVVDFAIELTGADRGAVILFDDGPDSVRFARDRQGEELPRERFPHSQTVVGRVRATGEPVIIESFSGPDEAARTESVHELRLGSATCVPLPSPPGVAGGPLGAIYVDSLTRSSGFGERDVETLTAIAAHAATALVNAQLLERARAERESLRTEVERLRSVSVESFGDVLGRSPAMRGVFDLLERVAPSDASVLVEGESGTGKELVARALHGRSRRSQGPFVAIDCGTLPESLIESELFGHRRGSFTGADRDRPGLFEQAEGGTILLDEIAGTSSTLQAKLLRVLQEREVRRVGDDRARPIDVRVIAASNRPLADEVVAGRFREDLYYRLNVVGIRLPPLRERPEDVPLLARHFLEVAAAREAKAIEGFQPGALQLLARFGWPGNVRQLQNVVERAVVLAAGASVSVDDLPPAIAGRGPAEADRPSGEHDAPGRAASADLWAALVDRGGSFWDVVRDPFARHDLLRDDVVALVSRALMRTDGRYKEAARLLGIADGEYKRFMDFLRQNRCHVDFRPFREAARSRRADAVSSRGARPD